jgi:phenylalanyl-tRNA synthetase beta chain
VMLATGQPLHGFDLDRVRGARIVVRRAGEGEKLTTLDDVERELTADMAVVCDAEGPSGIAGVMGGQISELSDDTTRVLMEAATWVGPNIMRTSKALGLRSEASARFEKQLHPDQAIAAQRLAARLMVELTGARLVPGTLDEYPAAAESRVVPLRLERIERLLGERIEPGRVEEILVRLGFEPTSDGDWMVPPWRSSDVRREVDLIEEVARVHGLDKLPTTLPARRAAVGALTRTQLLRRRLEDALRDRGLSETVSYSFTSPRALARLSVDGEALRLDNPLSEEQSLMRPLVLPGLLDAAAHNTAHGRDEVALFESARAFRSTGRLDDAPADSPGGATPADERHHLAALLTGGRPDGGRTPGVDADFYSVRALLDAVLETAGVGWSAEPAELPFLHPGRQASVLAGDAELGFVGELHPEVAAAWELDGPVAVFELDLDALPAGHTDVYRDVTSVPAVRQDIAVVVPDDVPAARVEEAVRAGGGDLLESLVVFDLYRGDQVGAGRKSLALRLEFRAPDRTLTDEEVAERRTAIKGAVEELGGGLRA